MALHNLMTCQGASWTNGILSGCSLGWLTVAIIVFLVLIIRKQTEDGVLSGTSFNVIGAFVGGLGIDILIITLTGSARWGLIGGIVGIGVGGLLLGIILGGDYG